MITIEISDESILFLIQFITFSVIFGWIIVQWVTIRDTKRRLAKREELNL